MRANASAVRSGARRDRVDRRARERDRRQPERELADAERSARRAQLLGGPQRDRDVLACARPARTRPRTTSCPAWLRSCSTIGSGPSNWSNERPLIDDDRVTRGEPGLQRGRRRLDGADREHRGVGRDPRDRHEDHEREEEVHHDAREEDDLARDERRPGERARIVRVPVLALETDEPADRQPVQGVERLAVRAQDLGARREPDPELVDADVREAGDGEVPELVDDHEPAEHPEEDHDRDQGLDQFHQWRLREGKWRMRHGRPRRARTARRRQVL